MLDGACSLHRPFWPMSMLLPPLFAREWELEMSEKKLDLWLGLDARKASAALPPPIQAKFNKMVLTLRANPEAPGLNFESIEGAADKRFKSLRVDQAYRAIAYVDGGLAIVMHVDKHDDAYAWAKRCRLRIDRATRSVDVVAMPIIESRAVEASAKEGGR